MGGLDAGGRVRPCVRTPASGCRPPVAALIVLGLLGGMSACRPAPTFFEAIENGDAKSVAELLANGIDPNVEDARGETPLLRAVEQGGGPIVDALLSAGADVDAVDREGNTALMVSVRQDEFAEAKHLLGARSEVNHQNIHGESPLIFAAERGDNRTLLYLLRGGADLGLANAIGENAPEVATRNGNILSAEILRAVSGELPPERLSPPAALAFWTLRARALGLISDALFDNLADGVVSAFDYDRVDAAYRVAIHQDREELTKVIGTLRETIETVYTTQTYAQKEREYSKDSSAQWGSPKKKALGASQKGTVVRNLFILVLMAVGLVVVLAKVGRYILRSILYSQVRSRGGDPLAALSRQQPDGSPVTLEELRRLRAQSLLTAVLIMLVICALLFFIVMAAAGGFT